MSTFVGQGRAADTKGCDEACWLGALRTYAASPASNRRALIDLEKQGTDGLPAMALMALADAHLRGGQTRSADRLFARVIAEQSGEPWAGWAATGRGWVALQRGDVSGLRTLLGDDAAGAPHDPLLAFSLGLLKAGQGDSGEGIRRLRAVATDAEQPRSLRFAAEMGVGLACYWAGRDSEALATFQGLAARPEALAIADEARFAAARVQLAMGDENAARTALEELAREGDDGRQVSRLMLDLDPRALRRYSARVYRTSRLGVPAQLALDLLDWNGHALARAQLAELDANGAPRVRVTRVRMEGSATAIADTTSARRERLARRSQTSSPSDSSKREPRDVASSDRWPWLEMAVIALVLLGAWLAWSRHSGASTHDHGLRP